MVTPMSMTGLTTRAGFSTSTVTSQNSPKLSGQLRSKLSSRLALIITWTNCVPCSQLTTLSQIIFLGTELMSVATSSGLSSTILSGYMGTLYGLDFTTWTSKRRKGSPSRQRCGTKDSCKVCMKLNRGLCLVSKS